MPNFPKFRALDVGFLNYDAETSPFTKGKTLTGGTSTATAIIEKITDLGSTGTLQLVNLSSTAFQNNETITDDNGTPGSATSDGVVTYTEYTWERWDDQNAPAIADARNKIYYDRIAAKPNGEIVGLEADSSRRFWPVAFPFIPFSEVLEFHSWAKRRVFWLYPNGDLDVRYKVEWQTYPFAPERLSGGDYRLEFLLMQVDETT